jgi:hypothetical protein
MYLINYLGTFHTCLLNNSLINFDFFFTSTNGISLKIQLFPFTKKKIHLFEKKILKISNISENNVQAAKVVGSLEEKWVA